jgi:hypothetical protein
MAENPTKPAEAVPPLSSQPWLHRHGKELQAFGTVRQFPTPPVSTPIVYRSV